MNTELRGGTIFILIALTNDAALVKTLLHLRCFFPRGVKSFDSAKAEVVSTPDDGNNLFLGEMVTNGIRAVWKIRFQVMARGNSRCEGGRPGRRGK